MSRSVPFIILLLIFSSCQKKRPAETNVQRMDNYIPPASEADIDTTQSYLSPSDAYSDRSNFADADFQKSQVKFRGTRNIYYHVSQQKSNNLTTVVEYLNGARRNGDTVSTATRILIYSENILVYRKAFPLEFSETINFSASRKCFHTVISLNPAKSIVYYWFDKVRNDGTKEKEYHAVSVDKAGITNELSGDIVRIGNGYGTVRFLNENHLKAKVSPNSRYPYLLLDLLFTIDWKACTSSMEVPVDTIFSVSDQPSHFFNAKTVLHTTSRKNSPFRETKFRRLTKAQMMRVFAPSFFDINNIDRDRLFIEFNPAAKGWIDHKTMVFEEIVSEN